MTNFNVQGGQHADQINMVGRDQYIADGRHYLSIMPEDALRIAAVLRRLVEDVPLDAANTAAARVELDQIEADLHSERPPVGRIAGSLEQLTRRLKAAGALASAGAGLLAPLQELASALGELGKPVLAIL